MCYTIGMKLAVMSDLHDNVAAWRLIAAFLAAEKLPFLINCGDTCAPSMLVEMSKTYSGHIDTIFGNVADQERELEVVKKLANVTHHGQRGIVTIAQRRIFFNHYPAAAEEVALSGDVDIACYGHTHIKRWEKKGDTYILNPGTAGGMFQYPSFAVIDLKTLQCTFQDIVS